MAQNEYAIRQPSDVAAVLQELVGWRSFAALVRDFGHVTRSMGAWHGWVTGKRTPALHNLLNVVDALGAEVVIRRRTSAQAVSRGRARGQRTSRAHGPVSGL